MGLRGPAPTPTATLRARGSWRAKEREGEVQFPPGVPSCPSWLSKEARAEWRRQVKQLEAAGVLAEVDRAMLAAYCEAWGEFRAISEEIERRVAQSGPAAYAALIAEGLVNAKNRAVERLGRLAGQFGFSPAARARVKGPQVETEETSGKARFFAG